MKCPYCGKENKEIAKFCGYCGKKLKDLSAAISNTTNSSLSNRIIKMYLDDEGNEVPEEQATRCNILELDENGNMVNEVFMVKRDEKKEKESKEYWDNYQYDPNSDILKNIVYYKPPNPIQEYLDSLEKSKK